MSTLTAPVLSSAPDAPADVAAPERRCRKRLLLAIAAIAGVLAGAVASGILVTTAFVSAAEDIGRGMSDGFGSVRETLTHQTDAAVEQSAAVAPGDLGQDPALDDAAQSCFVGDLSACDDLGSASPPGSDYAQYAGTCGGRVEPDAVYACVDLN
jgi:hypothetical protein